ncbi:unnamed protein product [Rhizoctonia solani]|uniref:cystathionine gamma-lyase n=1 Tax=Rhizoctonia solani TaxID=456999 RepID=A0A8H3GFM1_9AGAM|nr:unnamed protein product [Rhizoctonia solani]
MVQITNEPYVHGYERHSDVIMDAIITPLASTPRAPGPAFAECTHFLKVVSDSVPSLQDCWLAHREAKLFHLRMQVHGRNALKIARYLQSVAGPNSAIEKVTYLGFASHSHYQLPVEQPFPNAKRLISSLSPEDLAEGVTWGGMISFRLKGGLDATEAFFASSQCFPLTSSLSGFETDPDQHDSHGESFLLASGLTHSHDIKTTARG